ncbi:bifunctional metallophosphatase/5'-nucleotidase [Candidatus Clostridium radicumherbarum]|uniref:Bifunctional metallophosphatase/5'-nucleotidase n=1 Tax=Candidatus Clostridium radicumherbarum TaxID=3381662 RepID=A0ABW8TUX2_9CLOT
MKGHKEIIKLTILETSDIHGSIFPINYGTNEKCDAGLAKISTLIKQERLINPFTMLIDNGDLLQGTPITYHYARIDSRDINPAIKVLNYLNYDAAVIGNHEFNYGKEILESAMKDSSFPWLSSNTVFKVNKQPYSGKRYIIKEFSNGLKVAIIGLTTKYIPNWENPINIEGIEFEDPVIHAERLVKHLKEVEKVDVVLVSYHGGIERDIDTGEAAENLTGENQAYELCMQVPGIDVLLTGHQHRLISDKFINGVLVLQPGANGTHLGKIDILFEKREDEWSIVSKSSKLLSTKDIETDIKLLKIVITDEEKTQKWLDMPIGKIKGDMLVKDPMEIRIKDSALIEFINKVQMYYSGASISNTALFDNYSPGLPSEVTMRDIVSNYIYPNTLRVVRIMGKDIKAALERSASYFETFNGVEIKVNPEFFNNKIQHYNYDMWEGIDYILNISKPIGERVVKLDYKGFPLEMGKEYDVVMNNYRAGGGGEYEMFQNKPVIKDMTTDVSELIANYIMDRGLIEAEVNNNWSVIHD